jgi:hypothetical protein
MGKLDRRNNKNNTKKKNANVVLINDFKKTQKVNRRNGENVT